ncbi:MAG TPA: 3-ketoacyl-ACP reductase [Vicinamibacterales bacterium]|nr:3-ketoacyl-ACP reductase [Vicinamibacterales bacterium]
MNPRPVALVTGASRGIGRSIAIELARTHIVIGTYKSQHDMAQSLAAEFGVDVVQCDVASLTDRRALLDHVGSRYGGVDLLVNNAGMAPHQRLDILEAEESSFDELIATNLKGPHFLTQQIARGMIERGSGRIVFITSISAYTVSVVRGDYCISKAGLSMSAALYAQRLAAQNIQVFEIRPGIIRTDMIGPAAQQYEERIREGLVPQRRMGEGEDVARVVRAISDGLLDYSSGSVIDVDGGFRIRSL